MPFRRLALFFPLIFFLRLFFIPISVSPFIHFSFSPFRRSSLPSPYPQILLCGELSQLAYGLEYYIVWFWNEGAMQVMPVCAKPEGVGWKGIVVGDPTFVFSTSDRISGLE